MTEQPTEVIERVAEVPLSEQVSDHYQGCLPLECRLVGKAFVRYPEYGKGRDVEAVTPAGVYDGNYRTIGRIEIPRGIIAHRIRKPEGSLFIYIADPSYTFGPPGSTEIGKSEHSCLFMLARFLEGWLS